MWCTPSGRYWDVLVFVWLLGLGIATQISISPCTINKNISALSQFWLGILITKNFLAVQLKDEKFLHYIHHQSYSYQASKLGLIQNLFILQIMWIYLFQYTYWLCLVCHSAYCYFVANTTKLEAMCWVPPEIYNIFADIYNILLLKSTISIINFF